MSNIWQHLRNCDFLTKISVFDKNFCFWPQFIFDENLFLTKISIFDKNFDFDQKYLFWPQILILTKISIFD